MFKDLETLGIYAFLLLALVMVVAALRSARNEGLKGSEGFGTMRVDAISGGGASTADIAPPYTPPAPAPPPAPSPDPLILPVTPPRTNSGDRPDATNRPAAPSSSDSTIPRF